jgi:hypothetical protein
MTAPELDQATAAIVRVEKGRGFIVQGNRDRYVITAARCLPFLPPCHPASDIRERTFIIGTVENERDDFLAECLFVDPIADIAVLGAPDYQALREHWEAYLEFARSRPAMFVGEAKPESQAWLLSPDGNWQICFASHYGGRFWISDAVNKIVGGMSGSPIVLDGGPAVGVVSCSAETGIIQRFPNARLAINLPGWLLRDLKL